MNSVAKIIIAAVIVIAVVAGVWFLIRGKTNPAVETPPPDTGQNGATDESPVALTITYNDDGFSPATATVKSGEKVKVVNQTQGELEFASDPHPIHTDNSELNTGDIEPGGSKTFTAVTKGEWGFHNHYDSSMKGTLTVE